MHLVRVGNYTFNLENVTEIVDYGDSGIAVCFSAAWPNPVQGGEYAAHVLSRNLTGEDAEAMRKYIGRLAEDARAQVR